MVICGGELDWSKKLHVNIEEKNQLSDEYNGKSG